MAETYRPRRGSLAYKPMRRAQRPYPQLKVPEGYIPDDMSMGGFGGYKAGMSRVLSKEQAQGVTKEIARPVTIVECPPLMAYGIRLYYDGWKHGQYGPQPAGDYVIENVSRYVQRKSDVSAKTTIDDLDSENIDGIVDVRLLVHSQPWRSGMKKTPEILEMPLKGAVVEKLETAQSLVRKEMRVHDLFTEGQYVDAVGVTKGKGTQGAVQRHGVKPLQSKTRKISRKAGTIGGWHPSFTSWRVPQAGQTGYTTRTENNKLIMQLGADPEEVNPAGGFKQYGEVSSDYVMLKGSLPGVPQRFILLRPAIRNQQQEQVQLTYIAR